MKAAFIGLENKIIPLATIITKSPNYKSKDGINICGVMGTDIESTTNIAIKLNVKAYLDINSLLAEADIIFVCQPDNKLSAFSEMLKQKHVKNKILCHLSSRYDSSILSCGTTNTCYAVGFPYPIRINDKNSDNIIISFEGTGKRSDEFEDTIKNCLPKAVFCTKGDKRLSFLASRMVTEYIKLTIAIARKFYKISGLYDECGFGQLTMASVRDIITNDELKIRKRSETDIRKDIKLLSAVNYGGSQNFYKSMETQITDEVTYQPGEKDNILRLLKRKH